MADEFRTAEQEIAINEAGKFLQAQTPTAKRTNKTYRGLQTGLSAARSITSQFAEYCNDDDRRIAGEFFAAYSNDGFTGVFNKARDWYTG